MLGSPRARCLLLTVLPTAILGCGTSKTVEISRKLIRTLGAESICYLAFSRGIVLELTGDCNIYSQSSTCTDFRRLSPPPQNARPRLSAMF